MKRSAVADKVVAVTGGARGIGLATATVLHGLGAKVPVQELLKNATGKPLNAVAFIRYVEAKYLETSASSAAA